MQKNAWIALCSSHPHNNRTQALKVRRPSLFPPLQPPLFFLPFTPLPELVIPRSLSFPFLFHPPPPIHSASSLSESAISHLWLRFHNSYCHISLVSSRRSGAGHSTEKVNIHRAFSGLQSSKHIALLISPNLINHSALRLQLHDGNFRGYRSFAPRIPIGPSCGSDSCNSSYPYNPYLSHAPSFGFENRSEDSNSCQGM